jgi:hypothetical protein
VAKTKDLMLKSGAGTHDTISQRPLREADHANESIQVPVIAGEMLTIRSRSMRVRVAPRYSRYLLRFPFFSQGHTIEVHGPKSEHVPKSGRTFSWTRPRQTRSSRRRR